MLGINGTLIIFALSFIAFVWVMKLLLWDPITGIREARAHDIDANVTAAVITSGQSANVIADIESQMAEIRSSQAAELEQIMETARRKHKVDYDILLADLDSNRQLNIGLVADSKAKLLNDLSALATPIVNSLLTKITK